MTKETDEQVHEKLFKEQFDDEEVLLVFRKHPVTMRKGLVISSFAILIGPLYTLILTAVYKNNIEKYPTPMFFLWSLLLSLALGIIVFIPSWINWFYSVYIVTDQRLIQVTQKGLFHRSMVGLGLSQIQMVNYEIAGLQETVLGYGTIMIQTYVGSLTIHEVHHPAKIQTELLSILKEQGITASSSPADESSAE